MKIEGKSSGVLTANKVKITDGDTTLEGVASAFIAIEPGEPVTLQMRIYMTEIMLSGMKTEYVIQEPESGELLPVEEIRFKDGTVWNL